jgi:acyl-CoA synthetase (NDP forming)
MNGSGILPGSPGHTLAPPAEAHGFAHGENILPRDKAEIISQALKDGRSYLLEHESKQILEGIGITTTGGMVATSEDEAVAFSRANGFPVVLKIVSPDVVHKTDGGGVKLNLGTEEEVRQAYRAIMQAFPNAHIIGVAVQKMAAPGIEAIIGVTRDPSFGHVLMFGLGGVFVEILKDVTFRILPITEDSAAEMIEEIKGSSLLKGYRGQGADIEALKGLLFKISRLVAENPAIRELDLNPVFLYPEGCMVVDARIFVDETPAHQPVPAPSARTDLRELFYPASIAVLGATDTSGKLGYNVFKNLISHGFQGRLYPINPGRQSVMGVKSYKSILEVEEPVDAAVIIVPAETVPQAIEDCCTKGIKYLIIETAGFAEIGEAGMQVQMRIKETIRRTGSRILGPNCSGIINTHHHMVQSIGLLDKLRRGNIGLIAQAGVYAAGILAGLRHVIDFGIVATIGNKMDITETEILAYMGDDPNIRVVALYMEDVSSGKHFMETAAHVAQRKPVMVLKTGRTAAGREAVSSHTASLAGDDAVNSAAFRQSGIIRAKDNEHLFALMRGFSKQPLPQGPGVMIVTYTGSLGVAATDMLYLNDLRLSTFEPQVQNRLSTLLPGYLNIRNPVDCSFTMTPEQLRNIIEAGVQSEDVHSFIVIIPGENLASFLDSLACIDYQGKPVVCVVACKEFMIDQVILLEQAGFPVYSTPEMAAEVLGEMYRYGLRRRTALIKALDRSLAGKSFSLDTLQVRFRLIRENDIDLWTEFVNRCSADSLWMRFLSPFSATPERARRYCVVNPEQECAIMAEMIEGDSRKVLGIARLSKISLHDEAEFAVIVADPWQRKTLGHLLSQVSVELAKQWGVKSIVAETIYENHAMISILKRCQFKVQERTGNMFTLSLKL